MAARLGFALVLVLGYAVKAQNPAPEFAECLGSSEFVLVDDTVEFNDVVIECAARNGEVAVPLSEAGSALFVSLVIDSGLPENQG